MARPAIGSEVGYDSIEDVRYSGAKTTESCECEGSKGKAARVERFSVRACVAAGVRVSPLVGVLLSRWTLPEGKASRGCTTTTSRRIPWVRYS